MNATYWNRVLSRRLGRRRALAATGGLAAGAAILSACGGGKEEGGDGGGGASGVIYKPSDTTKGAKRGGVIKGYAQAYPLNFDIHNWPFGHSFAILLCGSKLSRYKPAVLADPELGSVGDVAESWEYTPDKLTLTYKINAQAKFSPLSPTFHAGVPASVGNRTIDADDILFTWDRWRSLPSAFRRTEVVNEANPEAPVLSMTKIDNRTVQLKLKQPNSAITQAFSNWEAGGFYIFPKEGANGAIDFAKTLISAGPFYIDKAENSVGLYLKRNPNYELRDDFKRPFADAVDLPLLQDPAAVSAQLRTGNIWHQMPFALRTEDILKLKQDVPDLLLTLSYASDPETMRFGISKDSPFKDTRVRQAMSYAWDRDAFITIIYLTDKLEAQGIPTNVRWNAGFPCNETGMPNGMYKGTWLDPKSKEFGENAKYFTLGKTRADDVAEAKKLLSAAGFANGVKFENAYNRVFATSPYSMDVMAGIIAEAGFTMTNAIKTVAEFTAYTTTPPGDFVGTTVGIDGGGSHHPAQYIKNHYAKGGFFWPGSNPDSSGPSAEGDRTINDFAAKMALEFDNKKLFELGYEFQRYVAKYNYRPRYPGGDFTVQNNGQTGEFGVVWPVLQNHAVWAGNSVIDYWVNLWVDETKPPVNKKA